MNVRVYFRKSDKGGGGGGQLHIREILGGNMKTHLAVYGEGLFDLRGGKCPFSPPPPNVESSLIGLLIPEVKRSVQLNLT